jgi:hypothetical protein
MVGNPSAKAAPLWRHLPRLIAAMKTWYTRRSIVDNGGKEEYYRNKN